MRRLLASLLVVVTAAVCFAPHGFAAPDAGPHLVAQAGLLSADEAARRAREKYGGKVLSVTLVNEGANPFYKVKLISDGTVRVVRVAARR